jgi:ABC-type glycerol-3-phosphate transport system substrate-binding protein
MNEETTMTIKIAFLLALVIGLSACTGTAGMSAASSTEADFGNSVSSLIKAQTANPATLTNPSTEPVTGVDPDYAGNVIEAMRESVSKPAEVKQPIEIRVGGPGGG